MGNRDDNTPRTTREFDSARLAVLTKQPLDDESMPAHVDQAAATEDAPAVGRAPTVDDPLTTGLLAEVARRSQTTDFDEDALHDVLSTIDAADASHPAPRRGVK